MDLALYLLMKYCSLQHQTLLPSPVTSTPGCCFCFGSLSSFFLELFLHSSPVASTYQPEEFIFLCPIFLSFHTVHGVLKARILKWFASPFSSGPHSVRTLHSPGRWLIFSISWILPPSGQTQQVPHAHADSQNSFLETCFSLPKVRTGDFLVDSWQWPIWGNVYLITCWLHAIK